MNTIASRVNDRHTDTFAWVRFQGEIRTVRRHHRAGR